MKEHRLFSYFNSIEKILWSMSMLLIVSSYILFDRSNFMTLLASVIGVTSLIFTAKGNPVGQFLMILFSMLYGILSYTQHYYGEMITYLGMTMPMVAAALVSWLRNPFGGNKSQVKVNRIPKSEFLLMWLLTGMVTLLFYFLLKVLHTANIIPSTISVATSFAAVYLTFRRDPRYAIGYAANDMVLIVLWILAAARESGYISVVACFVAFLINDLYGFLSWRKMYQQQKQPTI